MHIPLTQNQQSETAAIAGRYGIALFVLFGSQALGRAHAKSDIDIAYQSRKPLSLDDEARLILALSSVFHTEKIDIVNISSAPPLLRYAIFKDGIPLFEGEQSVFASQTAYAFKQYLEAKPLFLNQIRYLKQKLSAYGV